MWIAYVQTQEGYVYQMLHPDSYQALRKYISKSILPGVPYDLLARDAAAKTKRVYDNQTYQALVPKYRELQGGIKIYYINFRVVERG